MADDNEIPQTESPQEEKPQQVERPQADPDLSDYHKKSQDPSRITTRKS